MDRDAKELETYEPPCVTPLGKLQDITKTGIGGIMEHSSGSQGSTFSAA